MRRIAIGLVAGLATWVGSVAVAEAQPDISPTGPLSVASSATSSTFTADISLSAASSFTVKLWVYLDGVQKHFSSTFVPNPGTTTYSFSKFVNMSGWGHGIDDELRYKSDLIVSGTTYHADDWYVTVSYGARPTGRVGRPSSFSFKPAPGLCIVEKNLRREEV